MDKLSEAGIRCRLTGYNGGYIEFLGYTPETENLLEQEREEYSRAYRAWASEQSNTPKDEGDKIHESFKSNPTATIMKKKEIIQELKRYGYSRVQISTRTEGPQKHSIPIVEVFISTLYGKPVIPHRSVTGKFRTGGFIYALHGTEKAHSWNNSCSVLFPVAVSFLKSEITGNEDYSR